MSANKVIGLSLFYHLRKQMRLPTSTPVYKWYLWPNPTPKEIAIHFLNRVCKNRQFTEEEAKNLVVKVCKRCSRAPYRTADCLMPSSYREKNILIWHEDIGFGRRYRILECSSLVYSRLDRMRNYKREKERIEREKEIIERIKTYRVLEKKKQEIKQFNQLIKSIVKEMKNGKEQHG